MTSPAGSGCRAQSAKPALRLRRDLRLIRAATIVEILLASKRLLNFRVVAVNLFGGRVLAPGRVEKPYEPRGYSP
jgi:hypothetical protein